MGLEKKTRIIRATRGRGFAVECFEGENDGFVVGFAEGERLWVR